MCMDAVNGRMIVEKGDNDARVYEGSGKAPHAPGRPLECQILRLYHRSVPLGRDS